MKQDDMKNLNEEAQNPNLDQTINNEEPMEGGSDEKIDEKDEIISSLKKELSEFNEKYARVYADFENSKKRLDREKNIALEYANESLFRDLLSALDSLEAGIRASTPNKQIHDGLVSTMREFMRVLNKHGFSKIDTDCEFNPNFHQCVMNVKDNTKDDGEISQILQAGYMYKDRVLRASTVAITKN